MRLIDADALMREFADFVRASNNSDFADVPTWNDAVSLLGSAPTIEAEPIKHAYMLIDEDGNIECSNCGSSECWGNYCMNCGAKMDGKESDNGKRT